MPQRRGWPSAAVRRLQADVLLHERADSAETGSTSAPAGIGIDAAAHRSKPSRNWSTVNSLSVGLKEATSTSHRLRAFAFSALTMQICLLSSTVSLFHLARTPGSRWYSPLAALGPGMSACGRPAGGFRRGP